MSKKTDLLSRNSLAKRDRFWVNSWIDKRCQLLDSSSFFFLFPFVPEHVPCKWVERRTRPGVSPHQLRRYRKSPLRR